MNPYLIKIFIHPPEMVEILRDAVEVNFWPMIQQLWEHGRRPPTFYLWDEYLQWVSIPLKLFMRASREGNWPVYQLSQATFLPLLFVLN